MTPATAFATGFALVRRHPWLPLFPLLWEALLLGLAYLGVPASWAVHPLALHGAQELQGPSAGGIRGFLPGALPSLSDLQVATGPATTAGAPSLFGVLAIPLLSAGVTALFLGVMAEALGSERVEARLVIRRAWRGLPGLYTLNLLFWGLTHALPVLTGAVFMILFWLFFGLLPFVLVGLDLPLLTALSRAPGLLWGHLGAWWGLTWRCLLTTFLVSLPWMLAEKPTWVALAIYPWLGTALVAGAVTLTRSLAGQPAAAPPPRNLLWSLLALAVAAAIAWPAAGWVDAWTGWLPTRERAVSADSFNPRILRVERIDGGEVVFFRGRKGLEGAVLERGRFGWKRLLPMPTGDFHPDRLVGLLFYDPTWLWHQGQGQLLPPLVAGEVLDSRVAYLEIAGQRFPVGEDGPLFLIRLPDGLAVDFPWVKAVALDAEGRPIPPPEVKKP
ncbi:MAG: hypothetical protein ACOY94_16730 [Bacillota bacterium]